MSSMIPRRVAHYLDEWGYSFRTSPEFRGNFLSKRVPNGSERGGDSQPAFAFASLCAVPHSGGDAAYPNFSALVEWLQPETHVTSAVPSGLWLPRDVRTFTGAGRVLANHYYSGTSTEEGSWRPWQYYLLAARDGYFESGRQAGQFYRDRMCYPFSPLVAWLQRFVGLVQQARELQTEKPVYSLVMNLPFLNKAVLMSFGRGWVSPFDWRSDKPLPCLQDAAQLHYVMDSNQSDPKVVSRWFAERVDNIFGAHGELPRCYNRPGTDDQLGPPGELPSNGIEYWS